MANVQTDKHNHFWIPRGASFKLKMEDYLCHYVFIWACDWQREPSKKEKNRISTLAHKSTFIIYPYKNKYRVNRVLPLLENTQAAVTLGVNAKSDCFTPNSSVTVHVYEQIFPLKGIKYCV